jgi:hypothetical protein
LNTNALLLKQLSYTLRDDQRRRAADLLGRGSPERR